MTCEQALKSIWGPSVIMLQQKLEFLHFLSPFVFRNTLNIMNMLLLMLSQLFLIFFLLNFSTQETFSIEVKD